MKVSKKSGKHSNGKFFFFATTTSQQHTNRHSVVGAGNCNILKIFVQSAIVFFLNVPSFSCLHNPIQEKYEAATIFIPGC